jgi:hypothetical protein
VCAAAPRSCIIVLSSRFSLASERGERQRQQHQGRKQHEQQLLQRGVALKVARSQQEARAGAVGPQRHAVQQRKRRVGQRGIGNHQKADSGHGERRPEPAAAGGALPLIVL